MFLSIFCKAPGAGGVISQVSGCWLCDVGRFQAAPPDFLSLRVQDQRDSL